MQDTNIGIAFTYVLELHMINCMDDSSQIVLSDNAFSDLQTVDIQNSKAFESWYYQRHPTPNP